MAINNKRYINFTWLVLIFVFLVIIAGAVVRTTQSGMGCPDWPTCFGRWIPPINEKQLPPDFEKYLRKQDIDHTFNAFHTWIEWINRMVTGVLGFLIIAHIVWSFKLFFNTANRKICWLSLSLMLIVGIEAWLGKLVVDTNLDVAKISAHMLLALVLAAICVSILHILNKKKPIESKGLKIFTTVVLLLVIIQIVIGTDVREQVDHISKALKYIHREQWLGSVNSFLVVHESFAWMVAFACLFLFWKGLTYPVLQKVGFLILLTVLSEIAIGLILSNFNIPAALQPVHLLLASILAIAVFNFRLKLK